MARSDVDAILGRADTLASEIEAYVSKETRTLQFRADLAGLLVVSMASSYESCVKETLITHAMRHHLQFGGFAQNQFDRLNSRINLRDLNKYAKTFDRSIHMKFGKALTERKAALSGRTGQDITKAYEQILSWRHDFAHAGIRNTTVDEAVKTHRLAKRVLYIFDEAFC